MKRDQASAAAAAAFENALHLRDESELLYTSQHYARAVSLAVIGMEELGKAIACRWIASGVIPPDAAKAVSAVLNDHSFKQVLGGMALDIVALAHDAEYVSLEAAIRDYSQKWVINVLKRAGKTPQHLRKWAWASIRDTTKPLLEYPAHFTIRSASKRKERGLYVDPADPVAGSPGSVTEREAWKEYYELRVAIDVLERTLTQGS